MKIFESPNIPSRFSEKDWLDVGIPKQLIDSLLPMSGFRIFAPIHEKLGRQVAFAYNNFEDSILLKKAWKTIEKTIRAPYCLIDFFLHLPDGLGDWPLAMVVDKPRDIDVGEERERYDRLLNYIDRVDKFFVHPKNTAFSPHYVGKSDFADRMMYRNSYATGTLAQEAYTDFKKVLPEFVDGLHKLKKLLEIVDPSARMPTVHWKSQEAPMHIYISLLASLNHCLLAPKHSALATIANANTWTGAASSSVISVSSGAIQKAWKKSADKKPRF